MAASPPVYAPDSGAATTVDEAEVARFSAMAAEWWNPDGKFRPLHMFNPVRLAYIRDTIAQRMGRDPQGEAPLAGVRIVDIGCGGGLIAEPLAVMGAAVLGIDASARNIGTASAHAAESGVTSVSYRHGRAEELVAEDQYFDVVLALEVLEHVSDVRLFLQTCARLLRPGGVLFLATLNRTAKSYALAIIGAEYVLGWLPRGTHDWRRFLKPSEIAAALRPHGVAVRDISGLTYNPFNRAFSLSPHDHSVNYLLWAEKEE